MGTVPLVEYPIVLIAYRVAALISQPSRLSGLLRRVGGAYFNEPELLVARAYALQSHIPVMYAIVLICSGAMVATFWGEAPDVMVIYLPLLLAAVCVWRTTRWWRSRDFEITPFMAARMMRMTVLFAVVLGCSFAAWGIALSNYGGPQERAYVTFFLSLTPIGCLFCLMHLRLAAYALALTVLLPTLVYLHFTDQHVLLLNLLLVEAVMIAILIRNSVQFDELVRSRLDARQREETARELSEVNGRLANMDALTELPNRRHFLALLKERLGARKPGHELIVGIVDLDGFKSINDVFGHAIGDQVLKDVGTRLSQLVRPGTIVARLGGDEFGLVMPSGTRTEDLDASAAAIVGALQQPFRYANAVARLSGSVGFAESRHDDTAEMNLARADYAAYAAKGKTRGSAVRFSDEHAHRIAIERRLEAALMAADLATELEAVFQPIVDVRSGERIGYEALARWRSPTLGQVSPADFIPIAERLGLVPIITRAMVVKAQAMLHDVPAPLRIAVNLSVLDLASIDAMQLLSQTLAASPVKPCRLDFEITETAVMRDMGEATEALLMLLAHGARISLDDFGTGHSSLSRVQLLPLNRIKVDRAFVATIESDRASQAIVKTTVDLCHNLGLDCVIEGVETQGQLNALMGLGARLFQGFYFGKPLGAGDVTAYHRAAAARRLA
ncbi:MAG: EAL domain-containing protein [Hyphomicrobiales bacterium]|nr:MAG: EAL domain-containing protein [Hyphomicrobiales bacterium]